MSGFALHVLNGIINNNNELTVACTGAFNDAPIRTHGITIVKSVFRSIDIAEPALFVQPTRIAQP